MQLGTINGVAEHAARNVAMSTPAPLRVGIQNGNGEIVDVYHVYMAADPKTGEPTLVLDTRLSV